MKAVIFDFNGTLYDDTDIHIMAWKKIYQEISGGKDDFDKAFRQTFGSTNREIIKHFYEVCNKEISDEDCEMMSKEKERFYREYSVENNRCYLVPGAEDLMNYLKSKGYKLNLASASIIENINFFFKEFKIDRWFDYDKVTYDNGTYENKTNMYRDAAENIGVELKDCLVFEDSLYGSKCARDAGCENIILLDPHKTKKLEEGFIAKIKDFTEVDFKIFE